MKSISILGTSSHAGKSWVATALCAWIRSQGLSVAPFKGQNMANNAYATLEGGEIGAAQAVQAEACGLRPIAEMNPILLKPSSDSRSQIVRLGKAGETLSAQDHYRTIDDSWRLVASTLDDWKTRCDVLVIEGAGSPVELNLMNRDIANLRPCQHVDGKWILVADIERGGSFAQVAGTWSLLPEEAQARGLGFIVNKFRGDTALFSDAREHFARHLPLPYLGLLPFAKDLRIDDEDSLSVQETPGQTSEPYIAWIRYPRVSNTQDQSPWLDDTGLRSAWCDRPADLRGAAVIVLPGSKDTLADLAWLKSRGLADAIRERSQSGIPIVGICGGYQMLGKTLEDPQSGNRADGLGLLPHHTRFHPEKQVVRRQCRHGGDHWETYEIHEGQTETQTADPSPLLFIEDEQGNLRPEGIVHGSVWGSYQHGLFEAPSLRQRLANAAGIEDFSASASNWMQRRSGTYAAMGQLLEDCLDMSPVREYLEL